MKSRTQELMIQTRFWSSVDHPEMVLLSNFVVTLSCRRGSEAEGDLESCLKVADPKVEKFLINVFFPFYFSTLLIWQW